MKRNFVHKIKFNYFKKTLNKNHIFKSCIYSMIGFLAGLLNGLLGAGGGMLIVPALSKLGVDRKKSHATSICIILPICILSSVMYINSGRASILEAMPYMVWGIVGSIIGAFILSKIKTKLLRKVFGVFVIWAAFQLIFR